MEKNNIKAEDTEILTNLKVLSFIL